MIPGSDGVIESIDKAYEVADSLGYPVMVKASAGGGGKGIRIVRSREEMENAYKLKVPLIADAGWGKNWLEAH